MPKSVSAAVTPKKIEGVYEKTEGSGIWYVRYRLKTANGVKGKLICKKIGTRSAAVEYQRKVKTLLATGEGFVPATAKDTAKTAKQLSESRTATTVGQLCDELLKYIQDNPRRYKDQRNPPLRIARIRKQFGDRTADLLAPPEIEAWFSSLTKRPRHQQKNMEPVVSVSAGTVNRLRSTFSRMYRHGKYLGKVQNNPVRDVLLSRDESKEPNWLRQADEERLRAVLQAKVDACTAKQPKLRQQALHRIYELDVALGTGMRKSEQYGLTWNDVDLEERVIRLHDTKNGKPRKVYMNERVYSALSALRTMENDLHTSRPGLVFRCGENKKWWLAALKEAKLEGRLRWHDLRHTFATRLVQRGADLKKVQVACGHKTIQMTARYAHVDDADQRDTVALLD